MAKKSYEWKFSQVGGVTRVKIDSGEDIAHLHQLDQKLWTVLSCPVKGLEIDEKTLTMMDSDNDGKIRVQEVISTSQWLCKVLKNPGLLLKQEDTLPLSAINAGDAEGKKILDSAREILHNLGSDKEEISIADTSDIMQIFAKTRFNGDGVITPATPEDDKLKAVIEACIKTIGKTPDRSGEDGVNKDQIEAFYAACADYAAWLGSRCPLPYGDDTEAALAAYEKLKPKMDDYFMRCKLAAFSSDAAKALDVSTARIEAISDKDLSACAGEISSYPLAKIGSAAELPLGAGINPAWSADFANLKKLILDRDFAGKKSLTEADWQQVGAKLAPYCAWKAAKKGETVESLGADFIAEVLKGDGKAELLALVDQDLALEEQAKSISTVDRLLHYYRDFYKLLKNFVTLTDFYERKGDVKAIFQAGTLYIDQRSCDLCIKVTDMAKHNATAAASGMFLLYCDCTSKTKNEKMTIVAAMTVGEIKNLKVGKNALFYDRAGLDWDATVVKIIDNPISLGQAFWTPYRKFGNFIEDQINKFAADKDSKMTSEVTGKISSSSTEMSKQDPTAAAAAGAGKTNQAFDIAKFCGIFAAIGMALGYIGGFLVACVNGFLSLTWWQMPLAILAIMLIISGPSMIMAWLKLRKRNLAPLLNANGWAVNSNILVNILFGNTLTKMAVYPKLNLNLQDPFVKQGTPVWKKVLIITLILIIIASLAALYFTNTLAPLGLPFDGFSSAAAVPAAPVDTVQVQ